MTQCQNFQIVKFLYILLDPHKPNVVNMRGMKKLTILTIAVALTGAACHHGHLAVAAHNYGGHGHPGYHGAPAPHHHGAPSHHHGKPAPSVAPKPGHHSAPKPGHSAAPKPGHSAAPKPGHHSAPKPGHSAAPKPSAPKPQSGRPGGPNRR